MVILHKHLENHCGSLYTRSSYKFLSSFLRSLISTSSHLPSSGLAAISALFVPSFQSIQAFILSVSFPFPPFLSAESPCFACPLRDTADKHRLRWVWVWEWKTRRSLCSQKPVKGSQFLPGSERQRSSVVVWKVWCCFTCLHVQIFKYMDLSLYTDLEKVEKHDSQRCSLFLNSSQRQWKKICSLIKWCFS